MSAGVTRDAADDVAWAALMSGDSEGLAALFDRHVRAVYNFAFRRTGSWSQAEDIAQATFITVWRRSAAGSLPALQHRTALPWLLGVADAESRNYQRGSVRRRRLRDRLELFEPRSGPVAGDPADDVAGRLDDEATMAELRAAVSVLPPHERAALELVTWSGLTMSEAATALGVAEGTVKSRLARARNRLASSLASVHDGRDR